MFLDLLRISPMIALAWIAAILVSLTVHEFSHALVAKLRGDLTAEREGRLTLNPLAHLDLMGFVPMLLFGFGWAKPVPYNPYNLKNPKWDSVAIALAGPLSNFLVAAVAALAIRFLVGSQIVASLNLLIVFLFLLIVLNLFLMFFNVIPIHPLDGSKLFFALFDAPRYAPLRQLVAVRGPQVLMVLIVLSLLTHYNVFFFVSRPAFAACDAMLGDSCAAFFNVIFSA
ncbi:site-2 protease family protein [bacterium]|nr:site-2 protease family protein [bacterium]